MDDLLLEGADGTPLQLNTQCHVASDAAAQQPLSLFVRVFVVPVPAKLEHMISRAPLGGVICRSEDVFHNVSIPIHRAPHTCIGEVEPRVLAEQLPRCLVVRLRRVNLVGERPEPP